MTEKEIITKLITHYKKGIKIAKSDKSYKYIMNRLCSLCLEYGVCRCFAYDYNVDISNKKWIKKYCTYSKYEFCDPRWWAKPVRDAKTKKEILKLLTIRLDILKKELKIYK